jgi:hypothetical protein
MAIALRWRIDRRAENRIQMSVAGDVVALRCHVFWYGPAKSDASIWRMTTGAIYNPQYHLAATSAQSNSFYPNGFLPFR